MTCKDLIGYQLVSINDEAIVVRKMELSIFST